MKDGIQFNGGGIKCDNPDCDYVDMSVTIEDYPNWLNKPCPHCGSNLLTQADFDTVNMFVNLVKSINGMIPQVPDGEKLVKMTMNFNGSGIPQMTMEPCSEEEL